MVRKTKEIYCGNNKSAIGKKRRLGTKYECFKKGIGIGLNLTLNEDDFLEYSKKYSPIDKRKIYCGTNKKLPLGYDELGFPSSCLRKGVGIGKVMNVEKNQRKRKSRWRMKRKRK